MGLFKKKNKETKEIATVDAKNKKPKKSKEKENAPLDENVLIAKDVNTTGKLKSNKDIKKKAISKREQEQKLRKSKEKKVKNSKADIYNKKNTSTQSLIGYDRLLSEGTLVIRENLLYSRTIEFADINYKLLAEKKQSELFLNYVKFLNTLDENIAYEMSFNNELVSHDKFVKDVNINLKDDGYDEFRIELNNQNIAKYDTDKNNRINRRKFITYTVLADDLEDATEKLKRAETAIKERLKDIYPINSDDVVKVLSAKERLKLFKTIIDPMNHSNSKYDNRMYFRHGLTSKDFLAEDSADFTDKSIFEWGRYYGQVRFIKDIPTEMTDEFIQDLTAENINMICSIHINPIPKDETKQMIRTKLSFMNTEKFGEKRKLSGKGLGASDEFVAQSLIENLEEAKKIQNKIQEENEKMFVTTFCIMTMAETLDELMDNNYRIDTLCRSHGISLGNLDWEQKAAFNTVLPFGYNRLDVSRQLLSKSLGIFEPFSTQDIYQPGGFVYGVNPTSKSIILLNRLSRKNPSGFIMATPGSGKSMAAKHEIANIFLSTDDDIVIVDPESEYGTLVNRLNGEIITLGQNKGNYINPMELEEQIEIDKNDFVQNEMFENEPDPVSTKIDFLNSFFAMITRINKNSDSSSLTPEEISTIDVVGRKLYKRCEKENRVPTLNLLYDTLVKEADYTSTRLAQVLQIYVNDGSLNIFSKESNINIKNRVISFDLNSVTQNLKGVCILIMLDNVWNRIMQNKKKGKRTWIFIDEFYLMLNNEYSTSFLYQLFKRSRKYDGVITGITQNISDMLRTENARTMFNNATGYVCLLNQSEDDLATLTELYGLSKEQQKYIYNASKGKGLIMTEGVTVPFENIIAKDSKLYKLTTSDPNDIKRYRAEDEKIKEDFDKLMEEYKDNKSEDIENQINDKLNKMYDIKYSFHLKSKFKEEKNKVS